MLETPHVALGAAIAMKIGNPYLAIPLALSSHFLLEKIPHWNPHLNTEMKKYGHLTNKTKLIIAVDTTLALGLGIFIAFKALPDSSLSLLVIASSFAAIVPDLLESPYFIFGVKNKYIQKWIALQKKIQIDATPFWGILTQIIVLTSTLYWIFIS
ncbi:MAG TPA: hypothetical protein VI795_00730 [Patescibacteria group bacterium]|nr:hypothetical protein [Patescibacteria group bacterium]